MPSQLVGIVQALVILLATAAAITPEPTAARLAARQPGGGALIHEILTHLGGLGFFATTLRVGTPILLAALGALISDRAGVINIGVEGIMLGGAFAGVVGSAYAGSAWAGLAFAILVGMAIGGLLGSPCMCYAPT